MQDFESMSFCSHQPGLYWIRGVSGETVSVLDGSSAGVQSHYEEPSIDMMCHYVRSSYDSSNYCRTPHSEVLHAQL